MTERWIETQSGAFCEVYGTVLRKARTADRMFGDLFQMFSMEVRGQRDRNVGRQFEVRKRTRYQ